MSSQAVALATTPPRVALALLLEALPRGIHPPEIPRGPKISLTFRPKYSRGGAAEDEVVHTAGSKKSPGRTKTLTRRVCITRHKLCL